MTTWSRWLPAGADAVTTATPLGMVKEALKAGQPIPLDFNAPMAWQFFVGNMNGCIGEVSAAALLLGAAYMLWRRCITWHVPVAFIGTVAVIAAIMQVMRPDQSMPVLFHLLSGGLMLGALFMATDMATTPVTRRGQLVFGVGCGVLTMVIRLVLGGNYPEGVSYSILLMNAVTPLINRATRPRVFGTRRRAAAKAA
jgi:electron transport complex protein RnfD